MVGLNWLYLLHQNRLSGLLNDEMGLGKTIQSLALIGQLHHAGDIRPNLIIAPPSVLENWEREAKLWLPDAHVIRYHGSQNERMSIRYQLGSDAKETDKLILIVSRELFSGDGSDASSDRKWISKTLRWSCCIVDEAHTLKSIGSRRCVPFERAATLLEIRLPQ